MNELNGVRMTLEEVRQAVSGSVRVRAATWDSSRVRHVVAADLMSDVLTVDHDAVLLVTSLPSDQVARTADMVGAAAVVLVNGKVPQTALTELCQELNLPLICTPLDTFSACVALGRVLGPLP